MIFVTVSVCSLNDISDNSNTLHSHIYDDALMHCLMIFRMKILYVVFGWWRIYTLIYDLCSHKKEIFSIDNRTWVRLLYTLRSNRQRSFRHYIAFGMQLFIANTMKMNTFMILIFGNQIFYMYGIYLSPPVPSFHFENLKNIMRNFAFDRGIFSCQNLVKYKRLLLLVE
mgnify:CR=1 FL=1